MRKLLIAASLAGALCATTVQAAYDGVATSVSETPGASVFPGGQFTVVVDATLASKLVVGPGNAFQSFCLETTEYLYNAGPYDVNINNKAIQGNQGPGGDPLSVGTCWLYWQFRQGTLAGYNPLPGVAGQLQATIWWLEQEPGTASTAPIYTGAQPVNVFVNAVLGHFGNAANAMADANPGNNLGVVALNLYQDSQLRQDQLALVPEPTTMIAGALLLLPFGASTLRILRRNRTA